MIPSHLGTTIEAVEGLPAVLDAKDARPYPAEPRIMDANQQEVMLQHARMAKGGVIGVGNKGVVALRFND